MAAAYKAGDDASGPNPQSNPSPLGRTDSAGSDNPQQPKSPPNPTGVERNTSGDTNEEESNLRRTCDSCTISKIKCDGGQPCKRCQRRRSQCVYREKKCVSRPALLAVGQSSGSITYPLSHAERTSETSTK